ncbi:MAG: hypothetical protein NTW38_00110 [Candidatus Aminicenantes bacterium]|nr:hypothetical protein [Candidatus Aminicenantes bacterium]
MNAPINARYFPGRFLAALILAAAAIGQSPPSTLTIKDIESYLASAAVVAVEKDVESGRTMPWRVTLDDGRTQARALFKYIDRPTDQPTRHSYRYELAAYALSRLLELEIIPPVVEREIEGMTGSLQWYAENCRSERDRERLREEPPNLPDFLDRLTDVQIFEALVADDCGDKDDTLIHRDTWKVCRVDFSGAFRPAPAIAPSCILQRCSRRLFRHLEMLTLSELTERLQRILHPDEITALFERKQQITGIFQGLIKEKGEAAVLFESKTPEH